MTASSPPNRDEREDGAAELLRELNLVKVLFQARAIATVMGCPARIVEPGK